MASQTKNPAPLAKATGLGVSCWLACDNRGDTLLIPDFQATFVRRRTRLRPGIAAVVAELHFGRAA